MVVSVESKGSKGVVTGGKNIIVDLCRMVGWNWDYGPLLSMVDIFSGGLWLSSIGRKGIQVSRVDSLSNRRAETGSNEVYGRSLGRHV